MGTGMQEPFSVIREGGFLFKLMLIWKVCFGLCNGIGCVPQKIGVWQVLIHYNLCDYTRSPSCSFIIGVLVILQCVILQYRDEI